jgi:hypothetical protein
VSPRAVLDTVVSILILYFRLRLRLPTKMLQSFLISSMRGVFNIAVSTPEVTKVE